MSEIKIESEDQLQAALWKFTWNEYPEFRGGIWAVPNTSVGKILNLKDQLQVNKLISTGLLEGVWDIHSFWKGVYHIIETKWGDNQLTTNYVDKKGVKHRGQKEWGELMADHGAVRHVYRTLEEGKKIIHRILNGME